MTLLVPMYYHFGFKKEQVNHCKLQLALSNLNYDLFRRHLLDDAVCSCGYTAETSEHFLRRIVVKDLQHGDDGVV